MEMYQDGVEVFCLPDEAFCMADERRRSPLEFEDCPIGKGYCTGDCDNYYEDAELKQESDFKSIHL